MKKLYFKEKGEKLYFKEKGESLIFCKREKNSVCFQLLPKRRKTLFAFCEEIFLPFLENSPKKGEKESLGFRGRGRRATFDGGAAVGPGFLGLETSLGAGLQGPRSVRAPCTGALLSGPPAS